LENKLIMMQERAVVTKVEQGNVTVKSEIKSTCSSCQQNETCSSGIVAKAIPHKNLIVEISTNEVLSVGDIVTLSIPEKDMLKVAFQVYLWPLIGLIFFSAIGQYMVNSNVFPHEIFAIVLGGLGGFLGFKFASYWQKSNASNNKLLPQIASVETNKIPIMEI